MRKKDIFLIGVLLVVGGVYIHYFSHWFEKPQIAISASLRPNRRAGGVLAVFTMNDSFRLTALKVVPLEGGKINPLASPVWNLASDSNSVPMRAFRYGQPIRGMKPVLKGVHPDPLLPGTEYRLMVSAGDVTASKDFKMPAAE